MDIRRNQSITTRLLSFLVAHEDFIDSPHAHLHRFGWPADDWVHGQQHVRDGRPREFWAYCETHYDQAEIGILVTTLAMKCFSIELILVDYLKKLKHLYR